MKERKVVYSKLSLVTRCSGGGGRGGKEGEGERYTCVSTCILYTQDLYYSTHEGGKEREGERREIYTLDMCVFAIVNIYCIMQDMYIHIL